MKKIVPLALTASLLAGSCSLFKKDDPAAKERMLLHAMLHNNTSLMYKGFKISLRSFPALAVQQGESKFKGEKMQLLTLSLMQRLAKQEHKDPGAGDYIGAAAELYQLKGMIESTDEEQYPTILENVMYVAGNMKSPAARPPGFGWYNTSYEHLLLGAIWMGIPSAPKEFQVYEVAAVNTDKISEPEVKVVAELGRALTFYEQGWYYLSEEECTAYLDDLEKQESTIGKIFSTPILPGETLNTPEARYHELHGAGYLMRGLDRQQSAREDEALEDFEGFLSDMEKAGVSNESVWLIGTYVNLKKEKQDEAIACLTKLEQSDLYGENEKKALAEIKGYVSKREQGKALNRIFDKVFIVKLAYSYTRSVMQSSSGYKQLQQDNAGKQFLMLPEEVRHSYTQLNSLPDADSLGSKATSVVKDIFN